MANTMRNEPIGAIPKQNANRIGAKYSIPNHYDMFASNGADPHLFADRIQGGFIMAFNKSYRLVADSVSEIFD